MARISFNTTRSRDAPRKRSGGVTTQFLYDGSNVIQELSGGAPVANLLTGFGADETYVRTDSLGQRGYLADALNSTVALLDPAGAISTTYSYEPFGKSSTSGSPSGNSFQFTGREFDTTGVGYFRARYYDPGTQRFISEDPMGFSGGTNLYAYAANNPEMFNDPTGLAWNSVYCLQMLQELISKANGLAEKIAQYIR